MDRKFFSIFRSISWCVVKWQKRIRWALHAICLACTTCKTRGHTIEIYPLKSSWDVWLSVLNVWTFYYYNDLTYWPDLESKLVCVLSICLPATSNEGGRKMEDKGQKCIFLFSFLFLFSTQIACNKLAEKKYIGDLKNRLVLYSKGENFHLGVRDICNGKVVSRDLACLYSALCFVRIRIWSRSGSKTPLIPVLFPNKGLWLINYIYCASCNCIKTSLF